MHLSTRDRWLSAFNAALNTLSGATFARRATPTAPNGELTTAERALAGALMRVNHVGEVCAQALYEGQALASRSPHVEAHMQAAAADETDHLVWTAQRLRDLSSRPSLLNPVWYAGAFALGFVAGRTGDAWSLGFVVQTERQVEEHLANHLSRLPAADGASRAIVEQMKLDEARHATDAEAAGARPLPVAVTWLMRGAARVMTQTAHYI
jgi:ubiquinone biosynthesis monooxygenase Coq7